MPVPELPATFVAVATAVGRSVVVAPHGRHVPGQHVESAVTLSNPGWLVVVGFGDSEQAAMDEARHVAETEMARWEP